LLYYNIPVSTAFLRPPFLIFRNVVFALRPINSKIFFFQLRKHPGGLSERMWRRKTGAYSFDEWPWNFQKVVHSGILHRPRRLFRPTTTMNSENARDRDSRAGA
jgi:hypothetical protein